MPYPATPTAINILNGNPSGRPLNTKEPKFRDKKPKPPKAIRDSEEAYTQWKRLIKMLWPTGVLTEGETDLLSSYCFIYVQWVQAVQDVSDSGTVITDSKGDVKVNPSFTASLALTKQMTRLLSELGMTPSARARIQVNRVADKDSLESFVDRSFQIARNGNGKDLDDE